MFFFFQERISVFLKPAELVMLRSFVFVVVLVVFPRRGLGSTTIYVTQLKLFAAA